MSECININSAEYSALKERTGLSDFDLKVAIRAYLYEHEGMWPKLDEIPGVNSEESLKKYLKLNKNNSTKINNILETTRTNSVEEAQVYINNIHRDLYTEILPLKEEAIVNIEHRPSSFKFIPGEERDLSMVNSKVFIGLALERLAKGYGILTIYKNTEQLKKEGILDLVPEGVFVSAFILNGNIIVNSDIASVDAPVHELMHVLLGSLKFTLPDLYYKIVQTAQQLASFENRAKLYSHRSLMDVLEEVFVEEYAKFISGIDNEFINLNPEIIYQLNYEMSRTLDTILNGDNSVSTIPQSFRFGTTLKNLGKIVNSKNMESQYKGYADSAYLSRILSNIKSDLFKSKQLEEIC